MTNVSRNAFRSVATGLAALSAVGVAHAESLSERRAAKAPVQQEVRVEVACGKLDKENCAIVVPSINEKTVSQGVRLVPLESKGSVESMNGLCDGDVAIAVVQADVLKARASKPDCQGIITLIGRSAGYPYQGFAIVRADQPADKFSDMVGNVKLGTTISIAAGGSGSGGEATLRAILASEPSWKQSVDIQPDGSATALNKVLDKQLDMFFVMDGPHSPLLNEVRNTIDPKTKRPVFKFIDIRPNDNLLAAQYNGAQQLYATAVVEPGFLSSTKTIATPAVIGVRKDYYDANPEIVKKIRQGAEDASPVIAAKAGANSRWRGDFGLGE